MTSRPKSPESRTVRTVFRTRLAELKSEIASMKLAAIATEDGLLSATDTDIEPSPLDRRGAVLSSLTAVARTAAKELQCGEAVCALVQCIEGMLLVRPFGTTRKRLLLVVFADQREASRALAAADRLAHDIENRLAPK